MDVEMYKKMDLIMETMHQIAAYLSDYAKAEMNGKKITKEQIEKNKILEILFIRAQKAYRELQELISEDMKAFNTSNDIEDDIDERVDTEILDMNNPENLIEVTINDLDEYLEMAYSELRYISLYDGKGNELLSSIYKGTEFEALRNSEYILQCSNLQYLVIRDNIKNPLGKFSFKEKGYILTYMSQCKFYNDFAFKQINKYISDLTKKSADMNKETYENTRNKLIEQKYILYFAYLNNKYNGILQEKDTGKFAFIKKDVDEGFEKMLLGMSEFEIEENLKANLLEYKREFKEIIKSILGTENLLSKKGKIREDNSNKSGSKEEKNTTKTDDKNEVKIEDKSDNER